MSFRHLLLRSIRSGAASDLRRPQLVAALSAPSRHFAFSSAEEAAAERRLRIESPLDALRLDPNAYRQPRDPNAPRLPDSTSALVGPPSQPPQPRPVRSLIIVPNIVTCNILINAHCIAGLVDVALDFYRHILENAPFSPSYDTYRLLIKGLVDADRMQDAIDLLREMLNRGHGADSMVYNTIMAGFIDRGNMEMALQLFSSSMSSAIAAWSTTVSCIRL